jgi:hypothetical protein
MRNPVRSETDTFRFAFGASPVSGACVPLGSLVMPLARVAMFVVALGKPVTHGVASSP